MIAVHNKIKHRINSQRRKVMCATERSHDREIIHQARTENNKIDIKPTRTEIKAEQ